MRFLAFPVFVFLIVAAVAEEELPKDPETSFDVEPPLLIQEEPNGSPRRSPEIVLGKESDPARIEAVLEKAKKSATASERLFRSGVLAKVEAENRALKVVRLEADLANARCERAKENADAQQTRLEAGEISRDELDRAKAELAQAISTAQTASANRDRAELEAAALNLQRQQKLLALGSGRRSDVNRAAEKVAALQQGKN